MSLRTRLMNWLSKKNKSKGFAFRKQGRHQPRRALFMEGLEGRQLLAFTAGNLVVLQVGDGTTSLNADARPVKLLEFTPNGANGTSVALPTTGAGRLTIGGSATLEGHLTLSQNGAYLVGVGYDANAGTSNVAGTNTSAAKRLVSRIGADGVVNVTTTTTDYSLSTIRSAATVDGTQFWTTGSSGSANGVRTTTLGATGSIAPIETTGVYRVAQVFSNQLYVSTSSAILKSASPLPMAASSLTPLNLVGYNQSKLAPTSIYDFVFLDRDPTVDGGSGYDTLYVADSEKGVYKFSFDTDNSRWLVQSVYSSVAGAGIEAIINGSSVDIYVTKGQSANNSLVKFTDTTNYDSPMGSPEVTLLAQAGSNFAFRGLALSPSAASTAPAIITNPTNSSITYGQNTTFTATASGTPVPDVQWQFSIDAGANWNNLAEGGIYSGVTTTTLTLTKPSVALSTIKYRAHFSNTGGAADSTAATLTVDPKALSATVDALSRVYDGTTSASVSVTGLAGVEGSDVVNVTASGTFADKNVAANKLVNITYSMTGADAANYTFSGPTTDPAEITAKALSATATASNKIYDRNTTAAVSVTLVGVIGGDTVSLLSATANFNNKNVGNAKPVTVSNITLQGMDAANYTAPSGATNSPTATITAKAIDVAAFVPQNKIYDGNTAAPFNITLSGVIAGDVVAGTSAATFSDKNAGTAKPISLNSAIGLSGLDAGNYLLNSFLALPGLTANIAPKPLTATALAANKVYNGNTSASVTVTLAGVIPLDTVSVSSATGTFNNKNVGNAKPVTVSGITLQGADAANYTPPAGVTNAPTADITAKGITITAVAASKGWDGTTSSSTTPSAPGVAPGDTAAFTQAYNTALIGSGKMLTPSGVVTDGNGGANYTYTYVTNSDGVITATLAAPVMLPAIINGGAAQRSQVTSITAMFSGNVTLDESAFTLENKGLFAASSSFVNQNQIVYGAGIYDSITNKTSFAITFSMGTSEGADGSSFGGIIKRTSGTANSLADGTYLLTVNPSKVHQVDGQTLGANNNQFGSAFADKFFRMFGDSDGDGDVDGTDTVKFRQAQAIYNAALDWDGNGSVTVSSTDATSFTANNSKKRRSF